MQKFYLFKFDSLTLKHEKEVHTSLLVTERLLNIQFLRRDYSEAFFCSQLSVHKYVFTLLEINRYICLESNQWIGLKK